MRPSPLALPGSAPSSGPTALAACVEQPPRTSADRNYKLRCNRSPGVLFVTYYKDDGSEEEQEGPNLHVKMFLDDDPVAKTATKLSGSGFVTAIKLDFATTSVHFLLPNDYGYDR